jgi:UDP-N-acetylmuramoyl-L-alanyl-D-glutamate--2,6-diaminopimelate ligase
MLQNTQAKKVGYSLKTMSDYKANLLENSLNGLVLKVGPYELHSPLMGEFNAYNLLALFATGQLLGIPAMELLEKISNLKAVDGRFQFFKSQTGVTVVVDYAHTPDALENMLKTLSVFLKNDQKLITIVGCGGDRDKEKRPIMAKIAQAYSHQFILTSDNPRTENPAAILKDMEQGLDASSSHKGITIEDRLQAIKTASLLANSGDIVLIAGKGHEKYQEVNGVKTPFDDFALAWESFNTKNQ